MGSKSNGMATIYKKISMLEPLRLCQKNGVDINDIKNSGGNRQKPDSHNKVHRRILHNTGPASWIVGREKIN